MNKTRGNPDKIKPYRWRPGKSGNPGGRPRKHPITDELRAVLEELDPKSQKSLARKLAEVAVRRGLKGSVHYFNSIADRVEGKPTTKVEIAGEVPGYSDLSIEELDARLAELLEKAEVRPRKAKPRRKS